MANEPSKNPAALPSVSGGTSPAKNNATVPPPPVVPVVAPAKNSSPALFGGHKGGGKKRADGLVAGSAAAIEADKKANAERMRRARAEKKSALLPPPLSNPKTPAGVEPDPLGVPESTVPVPSGLAPVPTAAAPIVGGMFIPWAQAKLQKPAALITKIIARSRDFLRAKQVKKLNLSKEREKKILDSVKWRDEVVKDFSDSLAECATVELNRRNVPGAQHSHYITLAMSTGELIYQEIETSRLIESLVMEDRAEKTAAEVKK